MPEGQALDELKRAIRRHAERHADASGLVLTPVRGLRMMCANAPGGPMRSVYRPLVCLVLQGAKQLAIGRAWHRLQAGHAVVVGVDQPVVGHIIEATREQPYLAVAIELDLALLHELAAQVPPAQGATGTVFQAPLDADIVRCAASLVRLLEVPEAEPFVWPGAMRELHYWLLRGPNGPALRTLAAPEGEVRRVAAAVEVIRNRYREPLPATDVAAAARMSASALRRHFKAATSLSPLQFQKHLRLVEARRLMLGSGISARQAAFEVGYASASQFSRDYRHLFGEPPRRDVRGRGQGTADGIADPGKQGPLSASPPDVPYDADAT